MTDLTGNPTNLCSPHTRGWTASGDRLNHADEGVPRTRGDGPPSPRRIPGDVMVFPAHAGMDRPAGQVTQRHHRVPRTRGDGPATVMTESNLPKSVPRTRGDGPSGSLELNVGSCVFPAHAGMDRPRLRTLLSKPPVFPAHAGMDRAFYFAGAATRWCSPHTRGWTGLTAPAPVQGYRCSPHTRGWTSSQLDHR